MRFGFIRDHRGEFCTTSMCRVLSVSSSGFYAWLRRPESSRARTDRELLPEIRAIHKRTRGSYGSPRIYDEFKERGIGCGRHRIARIMRQNGIQVVPKRKFRVTTDSKHSLRVAPNLLNRDFTAATPNTVWVGDITYIWTRQGWMYLAVLLDLYSRRVVGWSLRNTLHEELVLETLQRAFALRRPPRGLIVHHDRGSQYAGKAYKKLLDGEGAILSMSRKGDCWDNAAAESFFGSLKTEWVPGRGYDTREEARLDLFQYIEVFYNRERRHSSAGRISPVQFELANKVV